MNLKKWEGIYEKICWDGPSSYEKRIYRAAVSQRLRNTDLEGALGCQDRLAHPVVVFRHKESDRTVRC